MNETIKRKLYRKIVRPIRYFFQRHIRGWDDSEVWHLPYTTAEWLIPRLERLKITTMSHPADITVEEYGKVLDELIWTFTAIAAEINCKPLGEELFYNGDPTIEAANWKRVEDGLDLYRNYWLDLWS